MKNKALLLILSGTVMLGFLTLQSCQKSAYPRDPYRGASANMKSHPPKRDNPKATRAYRSVKVRRTY